MSSKTKNNNLPNCYGILEKVFPKKEDGLRTTPETCFDCEHRIECLGKAVKSKKGYLKITEEIIDREYNAGHIGFLERWSKRKMLYSKNK